MRIAHLMVLVPIAALAVSCSSGAEGVSGKLDTSVCSNLASGATSLLATVSRELAASKKTDALRQTLHVVASERKAYQGGCITQGEYEKVLTAGADVAAIYHCAESFKCFGANCLS
jgi:hypothetical protein